MGTLPPGRYRLSVNASGFEGAKSEVDARVRSFLNVTATLKPAKLQRTETVQGNASSVTTQPVDVASTVDQVTIAEHDLDTIPLATRSFANNAALPVPQAKVQAGNVTDICTNSTCTTTQPITSLNQLRVPGGALGDFFGPGTTVGIPFAAQLGVRF